MKMFYSPVNYLGFCLLSFILSSSVLLGQPSVLDPSPELSHNIGEHLTDGEAFDNNNNITLNESRDSVPVLTNKIEQQNEQELVEVASPISTLQIEENSALSTPIESSSIANENYDDCNDDCNDDYCCDYDFDIWLYPNYFYLGHTEGRGLGYRKGYSTLGVFLMPSYLATDCLYPFIDAKGYCFNDGRWASSVGFGTRYLLPSRYMVVGANIYYDNRRIHQHNLNQIGVGFELLGPCWDFRLNGYIPAGRSFFHKDDFFDLGDGFFATRQRRVSSWSGVDAEIGTWIKRKYPCDFYGLYFAVGPYYYLSEHRRHHSHHHNTAGGRARLLARICDFIDFSLSATYDRIWHTGIQGQLTISIPFGCEKTPLNCSRLFDQSPSSSCCCERDCCHPCLLEQIAWQPVQRNGIIAADEDCCFTWNWDDCDDCPRN